MPSTTPPRRPCHVLGFDTSTEQMALAVQGPRGALHRLAPGGAQASATLLPLASGLLAEAGLQWADLDFIAFGRGPGAFTGLRTACAVAQGLGFGLGRPLLAIDSLLIVAEDARLQAGADVRHVGVAMDARMDEAYAAVYAWHADGWQSVQAPALVTVAALADAWAGLALDVVAGSALAAFGSRLPLPAAALQLPHEHDRAAALLRLALRHAAAGQGMDAADALPLYLRDKVALTTLEREAVRAAKAA